MVISNINETTYKLLDSTRMVQKFFHRLYISKPNINI